MDLQLNFNVNKNIIPESVTGGVCRCGQFRLNFCGSRFWLSAGSRAVWASLLLTLVLPLAGLTAEADPNAPWPAAEQKGLRPRSRPATKVPAAPAVAPSRPVAPAAAPAAVAPVAAAATAAPADFRLVPKISGIVVVPSLKEFNPDGVPLRPGLTVPPKSLLHTSEFAKLARWYINQGLDESRMRSLQREIVLYYRRHDRPLVDVLYPEQDVSNGMLQIIVIEGRLKEVKVQDAEGRPYATGWSGASYLRNAIPLQTNQVIAESEVLKGLDWLNRNPFRHTEAVFEPDKRDYGLTSILLRVDERRQWSADIGFDNTGSRATAEERLTVGATWGKAFGLSDNQFRYAFTADPSLDHLRAHSANYYAPLPWRHGLRLTGYYLDVMADAGTGVELEGVAYQASMRYEIPLPSLRKYQHEFAVGLDFKYNENNLLFNTVSVANTPTEIFQFALSYNAVLPDDWGQTALGIQGYYSPGDITSLNNDTMFNLSRTFAEANYMYARFNLERTLKLPAGFNLILRGTAQIADGNLLPSEQLGMGGYSTARGYEEREGNGDKGYFVSAELRTPPVSLSHYFTNKPLKDEGLQLLGFWDHGEIANVELLADEDPHITFSSVGVGLRYNLTRHFALRFDYGWQLVDTGLQSPYDSRGHIGVVATY